MLFLFLVAWCYQSARVVRIRSFNLFGRDVEWVFQRRMYIAILREISLFDGRIIAFCLQTSNKVPLFLRSTLKLRTKMQMSLLRLRRHKISGKTIVYMARVHPLKK